MDQIKPVIQWCQRNIFWIGCFVLAVTMIGSWVFSSMQLAAAQTKRESDIKTQITALDNIKKKRAEDEVVAHPNASTQTGMDQEIDNTIEAIVAAWKKRYDEQKSIMTWPEDILGKETADFFAKVDVPEKLSDPGRGFERFRKAYYDKIPDYMTKICRDVGVNWKHDPKLIEEQQQASQFDGGGRSGGGRGGSGSAGSRGGGSRGEMGGMGPGGMGMGPGLGGMGGSGRNSDTAFFDEMNKYPVLWDDVNQDLWFQKLKEFRGFDDHTDPFLYPTFMQANMLQQDLWLLEAMFKNIKEVNGGSASNDLSVIQQIDHIVFGREATAKLGQLSFINSSIFSSSLPQAADAANGNAMDLDSGMMDSMGSMGTLGTMGNPSSAAATTAAAQPSAYDKRYVDTSYEPIEASKVKLVLGGTALPETNLELIVAKRVPFRLAVQMDERKINEFIAICANSEFIFEVNQLRINRHVAGDQIQFNGGASSNSGGGMGMGGMMSGMGMGGVDMSGMMSGGMGGRGGGDDEGMSMGGPGMGGRGGSFGGSSASALEPTDVETRTDFIVSVEFYGIVKIYNPVRENFLRLAAGQEVIDETADAALVKEAEEDVAAAAAATANAQGNAASQPGGNAAPAGQAGAVTPAQPSAAPANPAQPQPNSGTPAAPAGAAPASASPPANSGGTTPNTVP